MPFVGFIFILTVLVYVAGNPPSLALWPVLSGQFRPWQLLTYALVHGNLLHLALNMLALLSFGPALEREWGRWRFLACYAAAAAMGGALQAMLVDRPIVGASAALFGLFAAYVVQKPKARIATLLPWQLPAWSVLALYAVLSVAAWAFGWVNNVAHVAHLGGMFTGLAFAITRNNKPRV